jgi:hypothetical protein
MSNVKVAVTLPEDAEVMDTLQTGGRTVYLGNEDGALTWAAPEYEADQPADALGFSLHQATAAPFQVKATWSDDSGSPMEQELDVTPMVVTATQAEADVTTTGSAPSGVLVAAGTTGVQLQVIDGTVPGGDRAPGATAGSGREPSGRSRLAVVVRRSEYRRAAGGRGGGGGGFNPPASAARAGG